MPQGSYFLKSQIRKIILIFKNSLIAYHSKVTFMGFRAIVCPVMGLKRSRKKRLGVTEHFSGYSCVSGHEFSE